VLTTAMKSVGEVMAIGRTFQESLQKALRGLETGLTGLDEIEIPGLGRPRRSRPSNAIRAALGTPTPDRLRMVAQAHALGISAEDVHQMCAHRPVVPRTDRRHHRHGSPHPRARPAADAENLRMLKAMGFSDARLASLTKTDAEAFRLAKARRPSGLQAHRHLRRRVRLAHRLHVFDLRDAVCRRARRRGAGLRPQKVVILGGGPNRIGQGIEFDYCCVHAAYALAEAGYESIMVNCNPETVSTDYDTSDRLYFEPLTAEDVLEILRAEQAAARCTASSSSSAARRRSSWPTRWSGRHPDPRHLARRNRPRRRPRPLPEAAAQARPRQPKNGIAWSVEQARLVASELGFPLVVRPSYVLGGRAMQIIHDESQLQSYLLDTVPGLVPEDIKQKYPNDKTGQINTLLGKNPLLFDGYLAGAIEVDVDCLCDGKVYVSGIMEHIEEAGIHSGDSACSLPATRSTPRSSPSWSARQKRMARLR
jgi:carbamoyl-phosphate synthase large subunit